MNIQKILFIAFILIMAACNSTDTKTITEERVVDIKKINLKRTDNERITLGDSLTFKTDIVGAITTIDSSHVSIMGGSTLRFDSLPASFSLSTQGGKIGKQSIKIKAFSNNNTYYGSAQIEILSDLKPERWKYKVLNVYKHDDQAYTQGLLIHNNIMYEGTGQKGESSLRKVALESGKVTHSIALDNMYFGEGVTIYDDKIIQLTWQSRKGFVYDIETFNLISEFRFNYEGWGITTIGDKLYASDGSHNIYILDAKTYNQIDAIQVYNNYGKVDNINEMEYIDGKIYANIYGSKQIIVFEPETGKITAEIDLTGILPKSDYKQNTDVMNGIAYNNETKQLFVTGKYWPKLFEIEIVK